MQYTSSGDHLKKLLRCFHYVKNAGETITVLETYNLLLLLQLLLLFFVKHCKNFNRISVKIKKLTTIYTYNNIISKLTVDKCTMAFLTII